MVEHGAAYGAHMLRVRDRLEEQLRLAFGADGVCIHGAGAGPARLPNTCNFSLVGDGLVGMHVLAAAPCLRASVGAACHTPSATLPSAVLLACGIPPAIALNAQRWSVGRETTLEDVDEAVKRLSAGVRRVRRKAAAAAAAANEAGSAPQPVLPTAS